jgi:putative transposase
MSRVARVVAVGLPHHITQRGNNRELVFTAPDHYRVYTAILRGNAERFGLTILGYCWMPNHVHLVGIPREEGSLAKAVGRTNYGYALWWNRESGRVGHLWQDRFYSCPLDEAHTTAALVYVELNPVRARLAGRPSDYPWSSAAAHLGGSDPTGLLDMGWWKKRWDEGTWAEVLYAATDGAEAAAVRAHTSSGTPLGAEAFVRGLEVHLGRSLTRRPRGRPSGK